jgi:lysophospholipase L1-like esterase
VWPAIHRPPRKGAFLALNRVLRGAAHRDARLVVVDWDREVAAGGVVLPDGLHPDAAGYARRSRMVADAMATRCAVARRR